MMFSVVYHHLGGKIEKKLSSRTFTDSHANRDDVDDDCNVYILFRCSFQMMGL